MRGISDRGRGIWRVSPKRTVTLLVNALHLFDSAPSISGYLTRRAASALPILDPTSASLPGFLTPIIGCEHMEAEVMGVLRDPVARIVMLVGLAGIGKTRTITEAHLGCF